MKVSKRYLEKVADAVDSIVMAEKKAAGVTRREQLALSHGIAMGLLYVVGGFSDEEMLPREAACRLLACAMDSLPDHREEMLSKSIGDAAAVDVVLSACRV